MASAERKRSEAALRESESKLRALFAGMTDVILSLDADGRYVDVAPSNPVYLMHPAAELLGRTMHEFLPAAQADAIVAQVRRALETQQATTVDYDLEIGGARVWFTARISPTSTNTVLMVAHDITERKQMEDEKEITVQLLHLLDAKNDRHGLLRKTLDLLHRWSGCDAVAIRLHEGDDYPYFETSGFPPAFVRKESSLCTRDLTGQLQRDAAGNPVLECMCGNILCGRFDPAQPFFTPHGSFWTNSTTQLLASTTEADRQARTRNRCNGEGYESVALIPMRAGGITYGLLQLNDRRQDHFTLRRIELFEQLGDSLAIALAQHQAQEALRASEERLRLALAASNQGIFDLDLETGKVTVSEEFASEVEFEPGEYTGYGWLEQIHPDDRGHIQHVIRDALAAGGEERSVEYRRRTRSGRWRWILTRGRIVARDQAGRPLRILGTQMDITERKQAAEALWLAQKNESLGILAGGVAHDFNNLLVAMLGQTSLALAKLPPESAAREPIEKAVCAAQRAADLTRQLLAYSGRGHFSVQPLRLNALIGENLRLLEVAIPKHVSLRSDLDDRLPLIQADAGQMQQVLMNLIINAAEAIGSRPGTVTIRTSLSHVAPADPHNWRCADESLPPGRYAVLQVSDDGCGMDAETLARIFDPFFTTKFTGRGLGLAAVLGIVNGHRGGLHVESTPGAGTTFHLAFPVATERETGPVPALPAPSAAIPATLPSSLILVIDDEEPVREVVTDILEMEALGVLVAADGKAGLDLYHEHQAEVRLVLLDLSMPGMSGEETFRELRALNPQVRILLSSGYAESEVAERFAGQAPTGFLQKPFGVADLTAAIRRHLAAD